MRAYPSRLVAVALAVGALLAVQGLACAQSSAPLTATASTDKQRITVGELLTLKLQVTCPMGTTVSLVEPAQRLAPFEIRDSSTSTEPSGDQTAVTLTYKLAVFEVGERELSGLELSCRVPNSPSPQTVKVPSVKVDVASVLTPDSKEIKDIRDPVPIKMDTEQWFLLVLKILLALAALVALIWYLRKRLKRRQRVAAATQEALTAPARALRELAALEEARLLEAGAVVEFYTRLSTIVREYLEARYDVPAMEQTTWMILRDLQRRHVPSEVCGRFRALLQVADLAKFAHHHRLAGEAEADLDEARSLVQDTSPAAEPARQEVSAPAEV